MLKNIFVTVISVIYVSAVIRYLIGLKASIKKRVLERDLTIIIYVQSIQKEMGDTR